MSNMNFVYCKMLPFAMLYVPGSIAVPGSIWCWLLLASLKGNIRCYSASDSWADSVSVNALFTCYTVTSPYTQHVLHLMSYAEWVVEWYLMKNWSELIQVYILPCKTDITDVKIYRLTYFYLFLSSDEW